MNQIPISHYLINTAEHIRSKFSAFLSINPAQSQIYLKEFQSELATIIPQLQIELEKFQTDLATMIASLDPPSPVCKECGQTAVAQYEDSAFHAVSVCADCEEQYAKDERWQWMEDIDPPHF